MCLIKGRENSICMHKRCANYAKHPEAYGPARSRSIDARKDFGSFEKIIGHSADWIMAVNPYERGTEERIPEKWNEFELFRQGRTELRAHGSWPPNRMKFHRSEISVEFVEFEDNWTKCYDVEEAAVYVGKGGMIGEDHLDVLTPHIEKPTVHFTRELGYLTPKQADDVLAMFDSKETYAKNFTALKTIARGFFDLLEDGRLGKNEKVAKMFHMVNHLQSALLPDDYMEMESILLKNKL